MQVEEVRGSDGFLQLAELWADLCCECQRPSFFLSHAWFRCCLAGLDEGDEPLVLLVRDGKRLVGIAPLLRRRESWRVFPVRVLSSLQNQDSPFCDFVIGRASTDSVVAAILGHLAGRSGWHLLSASKIERSSPSYQALERALHRSPHVLVPAARSPLLLLESDWQRYWAAQSQRFKKTVRNIANRVERLGKIQIADLAQGSTPEDCMAVFRAVATQSWKAELHVSVTGNAAIRRFFEALTATLQGCGQLGLWVLRVDDVPVATEYHVRDGDTVYALRSDFDDRYRDASPGAHLNAHIVRTYFERGVRVYDMGPGESEYKQRWASAVRDLDSFWLFNRTPYAMALYALERQAIPGLRRARRWLQPRADTLQ